ncbi:hypothetical protein, partial [uncultured Flavonifractor sp.]|uniref:hypothetical protein n=1 Tax=uncultured Flavonifractor sp. TaxID=1193534 RepID=UPI0025FCC8C0
FTNIFIPPHYYTAFFSSIREKGHLSVTFFDRLRGRCHWQRPRFLYKKAAAAPAAAAFIVWIRPP